LYLAASASAEFFADILLCPMEALKVRIQTQPGWANNFRQGFPKLMAEEGLWGYVISVLFSGKRMPTRLVLILFLRFCLTGLLFNRPPSRIMRPLIGWLRNLAAG